jgi:RimJ/RimL family protein N-acetyltransferase
MDNNTEVTIREADPADAEQLIAYVQGLVEEPDVNVALSPGEFNLTVAEEQQILANSIVTDNSAFFVAEIGGQIIGELSCIGGKRQANRHTVLLGISVAREWRNQGVGSKLMDRAIEWARHTGFVSRIELAVFARNEMAIHLYQNYGFVVEGRRRKAIYRSGEYLDDLIMALLL